MGARFALLKREGAGGDDLHATLSAAFESSYALLDRRTRELFERLAVFAGGWTLAAAAAVDARPEIDVLGALESLVDQSLVVAPQPAAVSARYFMLQSTREFALDKLRRRGRMDATRAAQAAFVAATFVRRSDDPFADERARGGDSIEADLDNVRAALGFLLEEGHDARLGIALVRSLGAFWVDVSPQDEATLWMARALRRATADDPSAIALRVRMSQLLLRSGHADAALRYASEAVQRSRASGGDALAWALIGAARAAWMKSELTSAAAYAREAMTLCARSGNAFGRGRALSALYLADISAGHIADAERAAAEATGIYRALQADLETAESLGNEGTCAYYAGNMERAYQCYRVAVDIVRGMRSNRIAAFAIHGLASLAWNRGERDNAWRLLIEGLGMAMEIGYRPVAVRCLEFAARWSSDSAAFYDAAVFSAVDRGMRAL